MISPITAANPDNCEGGPDSAGARWRPALDDLWHGKLDEVVALSTACGGVAGGGHDRDSDRTVMPSLRLHERASRAFEDLAAIEDAMARIDRGTYGLCAACGQRMPGGWLAEEPLILHCPDCSLLLVTWRVPQPRPATQPARVGSMVPHPAPATCAPLQPSARRATAVLPLPA